MIEFLVEDPRMGLLVGFGAVCFLAGAFYRFLIWTKPLPLADTMNLRGLRFRQTCPESPEQWDVYKGDDLVGYVRYRWGELTAEYPDVGGELVLEKTMERETGQLTAKERGRWLPIIAGRLKRARRRNRS